MPRGRKKKRATIEKDLANFTATKEDQLEVFTKKAGASITKDVVNMFAIKPVGKTYNLRGHAIKGFVGDDYKESLMLAYAWEARVNRSANGNRVELVDYFPQAMGGKSILVSYNIVKNV